MNRQLRYAYHSETIETWIQKSTGKLSSQNLSEFLELAINDIILKAQTSISEVTVLAILERVLYNSAERYSLLREVKIENDKLQFAMLHPSYKSYSNSEIREAFHYLITEFLFIIGNLTGEQLTPIMHDELKLIKKKKR